jgi:hypothetical protein
MLRALRADSEVLERIGMRNISTNAAREHEKNNLRGFYEDQKRHLAFCTYIYNLILGSFFFIHFYLHEAEKMFVGPLMLDLLHLVKIGKTKACASN